MTIDRIFKASVVLKDIVRKTNLVRANGIAPQCELYIKPENLQNTGSFKLRGSGFKIAMLSEEERRKGPRRFKVPFGLLCDFKQMTELSEL